MFWKRAVGTDIVEVSSFRKYDIDKQHHFLQKVFTSYELDYCFLHKDPSTHLAGIFAGKEAVSKALGVLKYPSILIEIRHDRNGKPEAYTNSKKLKIALSISHTKEIAVAVAVG